MATPLAAAWDMCAHLPPGPVLELGCGAGGITRALAQRVEWKNTLKRAK